MCLDKENIYLKNAFVALKSSKHYNQADAVALVTNVKLGSYWSKLFIKNGILVLYKNFDTFKFSSDYGWSLAFYKLCALQHVLKMNYDNFVLLDTDTYTQKEFKDIWCECKHSILLPEINKGLYNDDYRSFCEEAQKYLHTDEYISRIGGEFIAGSKKNLNKFMIECLKIYNTMQANHIRTNNGDEFILSLAAWSMRNQIKSANAYVFRYWTGYRWHYVCSNYHHNPVCVLHCPWEKEHGYLKLFKILEGDEELPQLKRVYRFLHLDLFSYILRYFTMKL